MKFHIHSLKKLNTIAKEIANLAEQHSIFIVDGLMGSGKTTLISEVCKQLNIEETPSSPTFGIVNTYYSPKKGEIYHFDFYRIQDENEAIESGLDEQLNSGNLCFVEWAEKIPNLLPEDTVVVRIEIESENSRLITIETPQL